MTTLSSLDGAVRPTDGLAGREVSKHQGVLGDHLDELKDFISQWCQAHERLLPQADRPFSARTFSDLSHVSAGPEPPLLGISEASDEEGHSAKATDTEDTQAFATKVKIEGTNGKTMLAHESGVFMHADEIAEATKMVGFSRKTQGRVNRRLSGLQQGLDSIMPKQGQIIQERVRTFEKSSFFELLCFSVITINTAGLALSTQRNAKFHDEGPFLEDLELACCIFYCFELAVRLIVHQFHFFYKGAVAWNIFDCVLVALAIQEQASKSKASGNMSYLRTTRILKVLKVLRIIRLLRFFKELRLIIGGIMASVKTLLWTVLLIAIVTFMFSICFVQGMTGHVDFPGAHLVDWSTILLGMVTLFMSSTGGIDWREAADPLLEASPGYYVVFLSYIFFFTFVIQNTVTSLFVECLFEKQNSDEAFLISDRLERREEYSARIQDLYGYMDLDRDGQVTYDELCENLHDPRMLSFAESLEMELTDLRLFFKVLTGGGKNAVDIETFVVGCIKLRGNAKSIDLVDLTRNMNRQTHLMEQVDLPTFVEEMREQMHDMKRTVRSIEARAPGLSPRDGRTSGLSPRAAKRSDRRRDTKGEIPMERATPPPPVPSPDSESAGIATTGSAKGSV